jgi:hypothetical protein
MTVEDKVHKAITHLGAALDLTQKGYPATADVEVRQAFMLLDGCWGYCERCADKLWVERLSFDPDFGKALCAPCWKATAESHTPRLTAGDVEAL